MLKISIVQMKVTDDFKINLQKIKKFIEISQGELILFPELALTGYNLNFSSISSHIINSALNEFQNLAKIHQKSILLGAPFYEDNKITNAIYYINSQKIDIVAEKFLLFPKIDEPFSQGKIRKYVEIKNFKIGIIICFELRSPEIARNFIKDGIDLLIVFAQWPKDRISHWDTLLKARAIENQVYVIGVNAISKIREINIPGFSLGFSPSGLSLFKKSNKEKIIEISIPKDFDSLPYPLRTPFINSELDKKLKSLNELKSLIENRRKKGQIMVFTNGCFDLLHAGHVHYLNLARSLGDFLVIGLNSDHSIKIIKGKSRPINSQEERAFVLSSLNCVDYIVIFDEETPENLIKELKPDILVKGADWKEEEIIGANFVKSYGGKVKRIPLRFKISTTQIIEKIWKMYKN